MRALTTCLAALAVAAACSGGVTAANADQPSLIVLSFDNTPGKTDETEVELTFRRSGAAPAKTTIFVPVGYALGLTQPAGTKVGDVAAVVTAASLGGGDTPLTGTLVADDPAKYAADPTAQACAPGAHAAVWVANLTAAGQTIAIPVYVDRTTGTQTSSGSFQLQACFASPDVPAASGGAPLGARVLSADFDLTSALTLPASPKNHIWSALVTPFVQGQAAADTAATYELRAVVPAPHRLTMAAKVDTAHKKVTLTGRLTAAGMVRAGVNIRVLAATKPSATAFKPYAVVKTNAKGVYTLNHAIAKTTYFVAFVNPYFAASCPGASPAPAGCASESIAPAFGNPVKATVKK